MDERNVPRVVKTVLPLVLILYIGVMLSYFTALTRDDLLSSRAIAWTWAVRVLGPARYIISIGVCLTALGSVNATFLTAGRLSGVAARNGQMPDVASWVHVRSKTPIVNVATRVVIATVVICLANGQELLRFNIFCVWMFHGMSILALLILRFKNIHKKRPYKVDLWIPIVVVIVSMYLVLAPFLQEPEPEFIAALVLIVLSLLCYHPIEWLKAKSVITVPDKITIWMQLFLRVAPKRDLRRERRSMMRRMSMLARDSILITPDIQSPAMMRRFSRRMSRMSNFDGSPALIRRLGDEETHVRRRVNRGSSMAEADFKRSRSNSMWAFGSSSKPSPAVIRKKPNRGSHSFSQADVERSPPSFPILKNRFNTTPAATDDTRPGALAPPTFPSCHPLHPGVRPKPSPIPEELAGGVSRGDLTPTKTDSMSSHSSDPDDLQVVADFESDGGGEYEILALPNDTQRMAADSDPMGIDTNEHDDPYSSSGSDSDSESSSKSIRSNDFRQTFFASLFGYNKSSSSSSSDSESSLDDLDDFDYPTLPTFYHSDDGLNSDYADSQDRSDGSGEDGKGQLDSIKNRAAKGHVNEEFDLAHYENVAEQGMNDQCPSPPDVQSESDVTPTTKRSHDEQSTSGGGRHHKDGKQRKPKHQRQQKRHHHHHADANDLHRQQQQQQQQLQQQSQQRLQVQEKDSSSLNSTNA